MKCVINVSEALCKKLESDAKLNAEARSCTGSLAVHPRSRDIKIDTLSVTFHGCELLQDTLLELNCGRRYGLIGLNGSGQYMIYLLLVVAQHVNCRWPKCAQANMSGVCSV